MLLFMVADDISFVPGAETDGKCMLYYQYIVLEKLHFETVHRLRVDEPTNDLKFWTLHNLTRLQKSVPRKES